MCLDSVGFFLWYCSDSLAHERRFDEFFLRCFVWFCRLAVAVTSYAGSYAWRTERPRSSSRTWGGWSPSVSTRNSRWIHAIQPRRPTCFQGKIDRFGAPCFVFFLYMFSIQITTHFLLESQLSKLKKTIVKVKIPLGMKVGKSVEKFGIHEPAMNCFSQFQTRSWIYFFPQFYKQKYGFNRDQAKINRPSTPLSIE